MAADAYRHGGESDTWILQELQALRQSLLAPRAQAAARRTTSLTLVRSDVPQLYLDTDEETVNLTSRSMQRSLSVKQPWLKHGSGRNESNKATEERDRPSEKKGIWSWKPIRALMHVTMKKLTCVFSVRVVVVESLPDTLDGLLLSVCVRKKESRDGLVQTMPCRIVQGTAEFDETLFMKCHVYSTPGKRFESRPFLIYAIAVGDAKGLDFGRHCVDLCDLIQESIEISSVEGARIPQWNRTFSLSGKARGGKLVLTLGFQIMEKDEGAQKYSRSRIHSASVARRQSRSSFSIPSSRKPRGGDAWCSSPARGGPPNEQSDPWATAASSEVKMDDKDDILGEFDVVDKGVEIPDKRGEKEQKQSMSSHEVVKEVVQDKSSLPQLIKEHKYGTREAKGSETDAEEEKITRQFLELVEGLHGKVNKMNYLKKVDKEKAKNGKHEEHVYVPDLGNGLGCIVQTRNGGYLAAANPCKTSIATNGMLKLAVQASKPCVIQSNKAGFEVFQKMASIGMKELTSTISSVMPMDELMGKTIEQIAFEGIASAVNKRRHNKEVANSSVKSMAAAMNNVNEDPLTMHEILPYSMHKIEAMAINALKLQADIASQDPPFDVSPLTIATNAHPLASAIPIEDWIDNNSFNREPIIISVIIQLRDPSRQYEAIGGPMIVLINATSITNSAAEKRYKVTSLQLGGIKVRNAGTLNNPWDAERQRLTALQWLLAQGIGKAAKLEKAAVSKGADVLWSISSRVKSDTWLREVRNPDVKFTK